MEIVIKISLYMLIWININAEKSDEDTSFTNLFNSYSPSTVNFQDIYTNTLITQSEDHPSSTDEELPINSISTQFAEFHPKILKISRITPPPKILLNSSYVKTSVQESSVTSTEEPEERIKVIPIKKHQKGVLDVLFPAARVKTFKNVFDSVRRFLSQTFRRR